MTKIEFSFLNIGTLFFLISVLSVETLASFHCETQNGSAVLDIDESWRSASAATLYSLEVNKYYDYKEQLKVGVLKSVLNPETSEPDTENLPNGYRFLVYSPSSKVDAVWGLEFSFDQDRFHPNSAMAILSDMSGKTFIFKFNCRIKPDLE